MVLGAKDQSAQRYLRSGTRSFGGRSGGIDFEFRRGDGPKGETATRWLLKRVVSQAVLRLIFRLHTDPKKKRYTPRRIKVNHRPKIEGKEVRLVYCVVGRGGGGSHKMVNRPLGAGAGDIRFNRNVYKPP